MTKLEGIKFNAAGDDSSGLSLKDILNMGSKAYTDTLKSQTDASNANSAVQLEKLKLQELQAANAGASSVTNNIKAYGVPLAIAGLMVIGGISAYFYFKKKKA